MGILQFYSTLTQKLALSFRNWIARYPLKQQIKKIKTGKVLTLWKYLQWRNCWNHEMYFQTKIAKNLKNIYGIPNFVGGLAVTFFFFFFLCILSKYLRTSVWETFEEALGIFVSSLFFVNYDTLLLSCSVIQLYVFQFTN